MTIKQKCSNFIKARGQNDGTHTQEYQKGMFLLVQTVVADMLEAAGFQAAKTDGLQGGCWRSLSRAFNLAKKSRCFSSSLFENDRERAPFAKTIEEAWGLTGSASDKLAQLFALSPVVMLSLTTWWWQKMRLLKTTVWPFLRSCS